MRTQIPTRRYRVSSPIAFIVTWTALILVASPIVHASAGGMMIKAISRYLAKESGETVTEQAIKTMTKQVGEELSERTAQKVVREGGEKSLKEVGELVAKNGPNVIRALDNAPNALPVLKLLDELPADEVARAAARLAAGTSGRELATLSTKMGTSVLKAEVKHPGVGASYARALGKDGADLSLKLTSEQAIEIGKHVNDIGKLPADQQKQLLELISGNADRFSSFVGRFVETNPGKVLFTAAGTTLVLTNAERILGGDEVVLDVDGNPTVVTKPGLVDRLGDKVQKTVEEPIRQTANTLNWLLLLVGLLALAAIAAFAYFKIRVVWRADRETERKANSETEDSNSNT